MVLKTARGFTIIELMVVLTVLAILAIIAAPSLVDQLERRRLEGVATDLNTDLQFARTQSVSDRGSVRVRTLAGGTSYVIDNTALGVTYKTVVLPQGITVTDGLTLTFDQFRGTADGTYALGVASARTAATMRVDVNPMGRVSLCSPSGSLRGYTTC